MNKLTRGPIPSKAFDIIMRYIFDDAEIVEEDYMDHDECRVVLVAELQAGQDLHGLHERVMRDGVDVGALHGTPLSSLAGMWMIEATRSNNNGTYWSQVSEMKKCHEVTETKIVTSWKPIDAQLSSKESIPARPASKE